MCGAVRADGDAGMSADNFHILVIVGDGRAYLFPVSSGREHRVGSDERSFAHGREARRHRSHVLFSHAAFNKTFGKSFGKQIGLGGFHEIGSQRHHLQKSFAGNF